jgi:hypothetical protein
MFFGELKYYLPAHHRLAERRSLRECWDATPWYLPALSSLVSWLPLPDGEALSLLSWRGIWTDLRGVGYTYAVGYLSGYVISYPFKRLHATGVERLHAVLFEDPSARLARKLQHASDHINQGKAKFRNFVEPPVEVEVATTTAQKRMLSSSSSPPPPRVPLKRQSTMEIKQLAMSTGFDGKRAALYGRISVFAQARFVPSACLSTMVGPCLGSCVCVCVCACYCALFRRRQFFNTTLLYIYCQDKQNR